MPHLEPERVAHTLLRDREVTARLGLKTASAASLALALVVDADLAPRLASELLDTHARGIADMERSERYASAEPSHGEDGASVILYQLTGGTRRCLELVSVLREIAAREEHPVRAA